MNNPSSLKSLKSNIRKNYLTGFLDLLFIEILIARFITNDFIRPYLGDFSGCDHALLIPDGYKSYFNFQRPAERSDISV